ncbi:MAG: hypothetical protein ACTSVZ_12225, partial [Promethearchaeota archaeon]
MLSSHRSYGFLLSEIPIQDIKTTEVKAIKRLEILLNKQAEIHFGNDTTHLSNFRWKTRNIKIVVSDIHVAQLSIKLSGSENFPIEILAFRRLEWLAISNHQLRKLPEEFNLLTNLRFLSISDGNLAIIPDSVICLGKLNSLIIRNNPILILPPALSSHTNLKTLIISNDLCIEDMDLRSFSGVPPNCNIESGLDGLTYWGMLLFQYSAFDEMLEHEEYRTHDLNNMGRPPYRSPFS